MVEKVRRRRFMQTALVAGAAAGHLGASGTGANDRIRLGVIGCGGRGRRLIGIFTHFANVDIAAIADVIEPRMDQTVDLLAKANARQKPERFVRHEAILDRKDVDAVVIATTQHWHGIPHIQACQAGKHVYVEKPLSHTVEEGRAMVRAANKHRVIAMMGTQQNGCDHFRRAGELIRTGRLGKIPLVECWNCRDEGARAGRASDAPVPPGYHWSRWLGPAPKVPFNPSRLRNAWWFDYSGGILTNWAIHHIDTILGAMGTALRAPRAVACTGGKFIIDDAADTPDTIEATWEFPGTILQYRYRGYNNFRPFHSRPKAHGMCFHGDRATMFLDRDGLEIWDDAQFDSWTENPAAPVDRVENHLSLPPGLGNESDGQWQREFLRCLRQGAPAPIDLEASHRATVCCHLANIAYHTGRRLHWDGEKETISDDAEATRLLTRPRREGYELPAV